MSTDAEKLAALDRERQLMTLAECEQFALDMIEAAGLDIGSGLTAEQMGKAYGLAIHQAQVGRPVLPGQEPEPWPSPQLQEVIERVFAWHPATGWNVEREGAGWLGSIAVRGNAKAYQGMAATPHEAVSMALALAKSATERR